MSETMTPTDYENLRELLGQFRSENTDAHRRIEDAMNGCEDRLRAVEDWQNQVKGAGITAKVVWGAVVAFVAFMLTLLKDVFMGSK